VTFGKRNNTIIIICGAYIDSLESTERKLTLQIDLGLSRIKRIVHHYELLARDVSLSFGGLTDDVYLIHLIYIRPYIIEQYKAIAVLLNFMYFITVLHLITWSTYANYTLYITYLYFDHIDMLCGMWNLLWHINYDWIF